MITDLSTLPVSLTPEQVAELFQVDRKHVQNNPLKFGLKKVKGAGLRVPRNVALGILGLTGVPK